MKHLTLLTISFLLTSFSLSAMDRLKGPSTKEVKKDIRTLNDSANEERRAQAFARLFAAASQKKRTAEEKEAHNKAKRYVDKVTR